MTESYPTERVEAALKVAREALLRERNEDGHWEGYLSSSALSTATAVTALSIYSREKPEAAKDLARLVKSGLDWLAQNANADGGWGDTVLSISNISTTALCWATFGTANGDEKYRAVVRRAEGWLTRASGGSGIDKLADAIIARYGKDRTFSVPILTMCALAGRLGSGKGAWKRVMPLPFELAACPHQCFAALRLPVVSYALPALIAIGQARHHHAPSRNPAIRLIRNLTAEKTLRVLESIQPSSGGFLEAAPLTSFVTMSLAGSGRADHPVTRQGIEFLTRSARDDGSWPIDTNLATWLTTLSVEALGSERAAMLPDADRERIAQWLNAQQYQQEHPYTLAAPGGWAWTDLPGGVPDADDTAGALLALRSLGSQMTEEIRAGLVWLLKLQNSDGGIPTFCRGWGNLPFDRSSPDLTAHALRAWTAWLDLADEPLQRRLRSCSDRAIHYLIRSQTAEGAWIPLWFGNEEDPHDENHVYGTARVLVGLAGCRGSSVAAALHRGVTRLVGLQKADGSWSGANGGRSSVEESALAIEALATVIAAGEPDAATVSAFSRGVIWLTKRVEEGSWITPSPIGFYFAKLWYFEKLYPLIFTVGGLTRSIRALSALGPGSSHTR